MSDPNTILNDIRIASPCTMNWDEMTGTDTVRFCGECSLNVYNISNMPAAEATRLIQTSEGRLCVRLYKRKDGSVITNDCPVGLRAAMKRATRAAGMALTAALGLFSGFAVRSANAGDARAQCEIPQQAQTEPASRPLMGGVPAPPRPAQIKMGKLVVQRGPNVDVRVLDDRGATVTSANVTLTNIKTGDVITANQDEDGEYVFRNVEPGIYALTATASGHETPVARTVRIRKGHPIRMVLTMPVIEMMLMGEIAAPSK